jgi:hypothetical protein
MWIVCGVLSVACCVIGWSMVSKKQVIACWASAGSLVFVAFTLLMQYKLVLNWVHAEDWPALSDVVPTTFSSLTGYVMIMLLANAILLGFAMKKQ